MGRVRRRSAALWVAGACVVGAAGVAPSLSTAAASKAPACTKSALSAGLDRGVTKFPRGRVVKPFGCAGNFAYAAVIDHQIELTVLYRAQSGRWSTVSRLRYCKGTQVPKRIRKPACNTN